MRIIYLSLFMISQFLGMGQAWNINKIIAHRGAWKNHNLPQNSLASLKKAVEIGCYGAEFDVRMTADNQLVIVHDPDHAELDIEKSNYSDLKKHLLSNGEVLPTLSTYLKLGVKQSNTKLILEIKASPTGKERSIDISNRVVALVKKMKAEKHIVYISFDIDILKNILKLNPDADCQYLNGELDPMALKGLGMKGFDYHYRVLQKNLLWIRQAKENQIITNAWTINDVEMINYLLLHDIDFITTDEPELALQREHFYRNSEWELAWFDEFGYEGLPDDNKWSYDIGGHGWGNQELQYYTEKDMQNVHVSDNKLTITAHKQRIDDNEYTSTRLVTRGKYNLTHGRVEARAKLPSGLGIWPAIWMLGDNIKNVGWPACGEIDIMEHVGFDPDTLVSSLHTVEHNHIQRTQKTKRIKFEHPYDQFHIYGVEYDDTYMSFYFDNQVFYTVMRTEMKDWPFDDPQYLLLNIAIGGTWGGEKGVDDSIFPQKMEVDYVRIFKKK
jgi:beta-glucanase (GH16 family)/glycerophosphoryl diester phosphodiesterase